MVRLRGRDSGFCDWQEALQYAAEVAFKELLFHCGQICDWNPSCVRGIIRACDLRQQAQFSQVKPVCVGDRSAARTVAIERIQAKAHYSTLPCMLLPQQFTIAQMHRMYEALQDRPINMAAFRRKVASLDFLTKVKGVFEGGAQRPAQVYRMKHREPTLFDRGL